MIKNITRNTVIAEKIEMAPSLWKKVKGLMFRSSPGNLLMDFGKPSKPGIWMFGMRFPIDILYLNDNRVVDMKENLKPITLNPMTWKVYYPKVPARFCLELPAGVIRKTGTRVSDNIEIK